MRNPSWVFSVLRDLGGKYDLIEEKRNDPKQVPEVAGRSAVSTQGQEICPSDGFG